MVASSPLFRSAEQLWKANQQSSNLPLSRYQKVAVGLYLLLKDYGEGLFPHPLAQRQMVYAGELNYSNSQPGFTAKEALETGMRKPWWRGKQLRKYLSDFVEIASAFDQNGVVPPAKLLELGCGSGWMGEQLAIMGYDVTGTSLDPADIEMAQRRIRSIEAKELNCSLRFVEAPMETVHQSVEGESFDAVFVYEALHHAYDWKETIASAVQCLNPGGQLFIFNEPGLAHTVVAYRVGRLTNTHEIGLNPAAVRRFLLNQGLAEVKFVKNRCHLWLRQFSLVAQKPAR